MNLKEAAEYLSEKGYRCKPGTVRRLANARKIDHFRVGVSERGPIEFNADHLDRFLRKAEKGSVPARAEVVRVPRTPAPPSGTAAPVGAAIAAPKRDWRKALEDERRA
jgi:hypothetical protein